MNMNKSIYEQLQEPTSALIDRLMSEDGEAMLDKEILQMREEMGDESFDEFAQEFFKNSKIDYRTFFTKGQPLPTLAPNPPASQLSGTHDQDITRPNTTETLSLQNNPQNIDQLME
jgi:hypothetical protein